MNSLNWFHIICELLFWSYAKTKEIGGTYGMIESHGSSMYSKFCFSSSFVLQSLTMLREQTTSTWLSATAKGVNLERFIDVGAPINLDNNFEPVCQDLKTSAPLRSLDHLPAYHLRDQFIYYKPEKALTDVIFCGTQRKY